MQAVAQGDLHHRPGLCALLTYNFEKKPYQESTCRDVPVEMCELVDFTKCKEVPKKFCQDISYEECKQSPEEVCYDAPGDTLFNSYFISYFVMSGEVCKSQQKELCDFIPEEKCSAVAQTSCESKGRLVCEEQCTESLWCKVCTPPPPHPH